MQMLLTASGVFQSTPPCGGDASFHLFLYSHYISIHAPLRGRLVVLLQDGLLFPISIHAPLRGRREHPLHFFYKGKFQSTPPCGGDPEPIINADQLKNFNPRPLAGATPLDKKKIDIQSIFQSTPPCGGDYCPKYRISASAYFNPRPLAGATSVSLSASICVAISIHAPLRGRPTRRGTQKISPDFNPRPLAGATVFSRGPGFVYVYFNPRPLAGATKSYNSVADLATISIHAPLRGRLLLNRRCLTTIDFNPRPLAGATLRPLQAIWDKIISIHAPLRGRPNADVIFATCINFNPRPLAGATYDVGRAD